MVSLWGCTPAVLELLNRVRVPMVCVLRTPANDNLPLPPRGPDVA